MTEETQVQVDEAPATEEVAEPVVHEPIPLELQAIPADALREMEALPDDHPDSPYHSQAHLPPEQRVWPPA